MKNQWQITLDEKVYNIRLERKKIFINNDDGIKLSKLQKNVRFFSQIEYIIVLRGKTVKLIVPNLGSPILVIDGKNNKTGEEYIEQKLPLWSYIFLVLSLFGIFGGAIGGVFCGLSAISVISISKNKTFNTLTFNSEPVVN